MRTVTSTVYTYDELSETAQAKARDWYRQCSADDTFWSECCIEDIKQTCKMLGMEIKDFYWSGFWSQGDGACFTGHYAYVAGSAAKVAAEWLQDAEIARIGRELRDLQRKGFYGLTAHLTHRGRGVHEQSVEISVYEDRTGNDAPDDVSEALRDTLRDLMRWAYRRLESEYEYTNADEQVAENIRCNEYEFNEEGERS